MDLTTAEDTERAERLARALGAKWYVKRWSDGPIRVLLVDPPSFNLPWELWDGTEEIPIVGDQARWLPKPDWSIVPAVIAAIEARGWIWEREVVCGSPRVFVLGPGPDGIGYGDDFPRALIDAFTAACEAQEGRS